MRIIKNWFIAGLTVLIPLLVTIYVIFILFQFADGLLGPYIDTYTQVHFGYTIPGLGIILSILIILIVGFIASLFKIRVLRGVENAFIRLPLVKQIYPSAKQIVNFLFSKESPRFRKTVLIEYPREGVYSIGFITSEAPKFVSDQVKEVQENIISVFIPLAPSPISGFIVFVPESKVKYLSIGMDKALKVIISGGMVS